MKQQKSSPENIEELEPPSKSAVKREMLALQDLGKTLCELPFDKVKRSPASERLLEAISDFHKCRTFGAKKRQLQFVGKVMRQEDAESIEAWVNGETVEQKLQVLHMHAAERWRDALVENPAKLNEFLDEFPDGARAGLNVIVRNAASERKANKPPKHYRALYQALFQLIQAADLQGVEINSGEEDE